jgi:hypothetical protein
MTKPLKGNQPPATGHLTARMRTYFSSHHLYAAAQLTRQCERLERDIEWESLPGAEKQRLLYEHRSNVIGALLCSTAFLEAMINEAFADAAQNYRAHLGTMSKETIQTLGSLWQGIRVRRRGSSTLERVVLFLKTAGVERIERRRVVWAHTERLLELRNAIVHYEPEWQPAGIESDPNDLWVKRLQGKFPENPLTGAGNPFFPDKCLSHGCALWAVSGALKFADRFYATFDGQPPYDAIRSEVPTP